MHDIDAAVPRPNKRLGQCFLTNRQIAEAEARYAEGMRVIELGPGTGILTEELCRVAKSVVAVEKDTALFRRLESRLRHKNLRLINSGFFELDESQLGDADLMVANIPYNLSSKTIFWLARRGMRAVLCIQKEFAERMSAAPGSGNYSRLSVESSLRFSVHKLMDVGAGNFYPKPRVDSSVVYLVPKRISLTEKEDALIRMIMEHSSKKLRNALADSAKELGIGKERARKIGGQLTQCDSRPSQLPPEEILKAVREIAGLLSGPP